MDELRLLVREQIKQLMKDDALFRQKNTPGVLAHFDEPTRVDTHDESSYMARPQLYRIVKNSVDIFNMLEDSEEISDWMESYIAQSAQMIDAVYRKLDYKNSPAYSRKQLGPISSFED